MTTQRRTPSGQGPTRRPGPGASRVSNTPQASTTRTSATRASATKASATKAGATKAGAVRAGTTRVTGSARVHPRPTARKARPALSRRKVNIGPGTTKRTVATRPRALTGRATVLVVVFVTLALAYTYPLRVYLAQKSQIAQLEAGQAAERRSIQAQTQELQKWQDPEYLRAQAREKLFYVRPGETPLLVYRDAAGAARDAGRNAPVTAPDRWYDTLWSSVRAADAESPN